MTGYIIYEGPSLIDGKPIVVIAQSSSKNVKTGSMMQTWIIRSDVDPITASRKGEDVSICGDCVHRGTPDTTKEKGWAKDRTCYVNLMHAPLGVYKAYKKGNYKKLEGHKEISDLGFGMSIRVGSYGDPVAVPQYIWDSLLERCETWTGYTHGETNIAPHMFMTSVETLSDAQKAWNNGERTFRVIPSAEHIEASKEFLCPASEEMGKRLTCIECKMCRGTDSKAKSVAIVAHGNVKNKARNKILALD